KPAKAGFFYAHTQAFANGHLALMPHPDGWAEGCCSQISALYLWRISGCCASLLLHQRPQNRATIARAAECQDRLRQLAQLAGEVIDLLLRNLAAHHRQKLITQPVLLRGFAYLIGQRLIGAFMV